MAHPKVAEAAVVGFPHELKGQGIYAYVTLKLGEEPSEELRKELVTWVRKEIGPIASPDAIQWALALPKTRSGKIMRRILRKIAANETDSMGDTSTLADPAVVTRTGRQPRAIAWRYRRPERSPISDCQSGCIRNVAVPHLTGICQEATHLTLLQIEALANRRRNAGAVRFLWARYDLVAALALIGCRSPPAWCRQRRLRGLLQFRHHHHSFGAGHQPCCGGVRHRRWRDAPWCPGTLIPPRYRSPR